MLCLIDIDGTVANWNERSKRAGIAPDRNNAAAFQEWLDKVQSEKMLAKDKPITSVVELVNALYTEGHTIIFLTGRSEIYRNVTMNWLLRHLDVASPTLHMRSNNDWRSPAKYKESVIKTLLKGHRGPVLAVDDDFDGDTSAVYKEYGITHLKVLT